MSRLKVALFLTVALTASVLSTAMPTSAATQPFKTTRVPGTTFGFNWAADVSSLGDRVLMRDNSESSVLDTASGKTITLKMLGATDISGDGQFVFGVDQTTGTVLREKVGSRTVKRLTAALPANGEWGAQDLEPSISGRYLAITAASGVFGRVVVFRADTKTGKVTEVAAGLPQGSTYNSSHATISGDGSRVAFSVTTSVGAPAQIHLYDADSRAVTLVTRTSSGRVSVGAATAPAISSDGRFVAFVSDGSDLVAGATFVQPRLYLRDVDGRSTRLVSNDVITTSQGLYGVLISSDGARIVYTRNAPIRIKNVGTVDGVQLFMWTKGATQRVTYNTNKGLPNGEVTGPVMSDIGRTAYFSSYGTNYSTSGKAGVFRVALSAF